MLRLALAEMQRSWLRYTLMLLSVATAMGLLAIGSAIDVEGGAAGGAAAKRRMITVNRINYTHPLPLEYMDKIRLLDGVAHATHATWMGLFHPEPKDQLVAFAVDHRTYFSVYSHLGVSAPALEDFMSRRNALLIGRDLAQRLGLARGAPLRLRSNIYSDGSPGWEFVVSGTFDVTTRDGTTDYLLARYDYFDPLRRFKNGTIGQVVFITRSAQTNDELSRQIDDMFANAPAQTITESTASFNRAFVGQLDGIARVIYWAGWAAFASALFTVHASLLFAVRAQAREYGLLKVLGFSWASIVWRIVTPLATVVGIGVALGIGAAVAMVSMMVATGVDEARSIAIGGSTLLVPLGAALALMAICAALPCLVGTRIAALRVLQSGE